MGSPYSKITLRANLNNRTNVKRKEKREVYRNCWMKKQNSFYAPVWLIVGTRAERFSIVTSRNLMVMFVPLLLISFVNRLDSTVFAWATIATINQLLPRNTVGTKRTRRRPTAGTSFACRLIITSTQPGN